MRECEVKMLVPDSFELPDLDGPIPGATLGEFDNLAAVPKSVLTRRLGQLGVGGRQQICSALDAMANC